MGVAREVGGTCGAGPAGREEHVTELVTEQQAAALLHVSVKCLQGWPSRGGGPPFVKLGQSGAMGSRISNPSCGPPSGPRLAILARPPRAAHASASSTCSTKPGAR